MKRYIAMGLAAVLLLAGCAGGGSEASPSPTAAPSPVATEAQTPAQTEADSPADTDAADADIAFDTVDINAYKVDSSIFGEKKLTMVTFWATYCFYCKEEMPGLGNLARDMPEGAQIIGVVTDAYDEETILAARDIVADNKADYPNLLIDQGLLDYLPNVRVLPTTVFFDENGRQVGERIEGMMTEDEHRAEIERLLATL